MLTGDELSDEILRIIIWPLSYVELIAPKNNRIWYCERYV